MAINKVGSKGILDGSVAAADFGAGAITSAKLADGAVTNAKLSNSSITVSGTSVALGASGTLNNQFVDWQSVITSNTTMVAGRGYFVNTTGGAISMTLPASATIGDLVVIKDYAGTFATNKLTILRNSHNIQGVANDSLIDTNRASIVLVYVDATKGWLYTDEHNVADLQSPLFTEATGGTVTTSGDYKIHTFTGDGNFVVPQVGNGPTPVSGGGPNTVSYLVIAGGGGGGGHGASNGGGGGAGGFREGRDISPSYTASPLVNSSGLTITAQTYPVSVGGGGVSCFNSTSGGNSVFSTITSTGGGGGSSGYSPAGASAKTGGSGGGGSSGSHTPGANGNTPPVSPPQGNNGGNGQGGCGYAGAGGGGAGAVGAQGGPNSYGSAGGAGGAGSTTHITGSPVTRAGGGGGFSYAGTAGAGGSGGGGAGGRGANSPAPTDTNATDGSANTGSGGGGRAIASAPGGGGGGGKGLVVIRYKFQ